MFKIGNIELEYLYHPYNCGMGKHRTERTIELPIADYWLSHIDNPFEIGAVTPYYFPNRIKDVVDPVDPKATIKESLFDVDFTDRDVLSISTIEHINTGEYGVVEKDQTVNGVLALNFIMSNTNRYLITFPFGCNKSLDSYIMEHKLDVGCNLYMISRQKDESWLCVGENGLLPYGNCMANSIIVLERGGIFETQNKRY